MLDTWLFSILVIMNSAAVNMMENAFVDTLFMCLSVYWVVGSGSSGSSVDGFKRNLNTVFHSSWSNFHSHQQSMCSLFLHLFQDCKTYSPKTSWRCCYGTAKPNFAHPKHRKQITYIGVMKKADIFFAV